MADPRSGEAWVTIITWCKTNLPWTCHLCGQPIPQVHRNHPLAYQVDHVHPVATHPWLARVHANLRPSHRRCNRYRSDRPLTPALIAEITTRYGVTAERPAMQFFD